MGTPIIVAQDIRGFIRRVYAETASSIGQVFEEDRAASVIQISHVRVCCGTDPVNRTMEGAYKLPDNTPWIVELFFKKGSIEGAGSSGMAIDMGPNEGSFYVSNLSIIGLQGVGAEWKRRLVKEGVTKIGDLARLPRKSVFQLVQKFGSRQILEFHAKALLATAPVPPIPESPVMDMSIFEILQKEAAELAEASLALSEKEVSRLVVYLSNLISVLDDVVFEGVLLRRLLL